MLVLMAVFAFLFPSRRYGGSMTSHLGTKQAEKDALKYINCIVSEKNTYMHYNTTFKNTEHLDRIFWPEA